MTRLADRKKHRREYLRKKRKTYSEIVWYALIPVGVTIGLFWDKYYWLGWIYLVSLIVGVPLFYWWTQARLKEIRSIPHIPPVTPDTLPAEEVLVQGAEQPSAPRDTLLRPAAEDAQIPTEQLLRATNGAGSEQP